MKTFNERRIPDILKKADSVLIATHFQPDGDAIGSALGLCLALREMGKEAWVVCQDPVPLSMRFLPGQEFVKTPEAVSQTPVDVFVSVDASDARRIGTAADCKALGRVSVQIDHHQTSETFCDLCEVDAACAATGILILRLLLDMGAPLSKETASCLYTAVSTDTGNFCFGLMTDEIFEEMAMLMRAGLDLQDHARRLHLTRTKGHIRLLARALGRLEFFADGRVAGLWLCAEDFAECGASMEDAGGIVNRALYIPGVQMAYMGTETKDGVQFNLRSIEPKHVSGVARSFGGGGHHLASGCTIPGEMNKALETMKKAMIAECTA